jgi:ABC-type amino acid transport substrate-binding protein
MKTFLILSRVMKQWLLAVALLLFFFVSAAMARQSGLSPQLSSQLTHEERAWLAEKHTVRVRVFDWPPYMFTRPVSGIAVDYLDAIAKRLGFKVEFVTTQISWTDALEDVKGVRKHFDLLPTMIRTAEREREFAMTAENVETASATSPS